MSSPPRIGLDATSWLNRRGYGRFARNALGRLIEQDAARRYVLVIDEAGAREAELPAAADVLTVPLRCSSTEAASAGSARPVGDLYRLTRAAVRERFSAFLFPSIYTWFPVPNARAVVGIHDLIAEDFPQLTLPTLGARTRWNLKREAAVRTASALFTVSEASRTALAVRLKVAPERVNVVPGAPDPVFSLRSGERLREQLGPLGLAEGPFFLYAGGISPHKNIETLLDAYAALVRESDDTPLLVVPGALEDEPYLSAAGSIRSRISALRLENHVLLPGFVSDEILACLYGAASAMVSPSLSEGFGLPAVEAAACGAAVVLSDIPAHRESLGDAALYFPPRDAGALAGILRRLLADAALVRAQQERAHARVDGLSWDASARQLADLVAGVARA